jgi:hypothetical protein
MASSTKIFHYAPAAPTTEETGIRFLPIGSAGTRRALRRMVHPTAGIVPIVYWSNPDKTMNLDNDVLAHPITAAILALSGTKVQRFERETEDIIITEIWQADQGRFSMPTSFARELWNYLHGEPEYAPLAPQYIQWQPRDRNDYTFNVELLSLRIGQGSGESDFFDILDFRPSGGIYDPERGGEVMGIIDDLSTEETGLVDAEVRLQFRVVNRVA